MPSPSVGTVVTTTYLYDVNDERIALGANGSTTTYPFTETGSEDAEIEIPKGMIDIVAGMAISRYDDLNDDVTNAIAEEICRAVLLFRE